MFSGVFCNYKYTLFAGYWFCKMIFANLLLIITVALVISYFAAKYFYWLFKSDDVLNYALPRNLHNLFFKNDDLSSQTYSQYFISFLMLNIVAAVLVILVLMLQKYLPLNVRSLEGLSFDLALNISISFITGTNWQAYSGGDKLSMMSQTILAFCAFVSSASGLAVAVAFIRGISFNPKNSEGYAFGNFFQDFFRALVFVFIPACFVLSIIFILLDVPQTIIEYQDYKGFDGAKNSITSGFIAGFEAIKIFGVNGGGYFSSSSANYLENPNVFTNLLQNILMITMPLSIVLLYARFIDRLKHGYFIVGLISGFLMLSSYLINSYELINIPFSGKEIRFGNLQTALYSAFSIMSSGSSSANYVLFTPNSELVLMLDLLSGSAVLGGIGGGIMNMFVFIILAVFFCGVMAGRTPRFIGKKIGSNEIKLVIIYLFVYQSIILISTAFVFYAEIASQFVSVSGHKAITQVLFLFTTTTVNNGSGFGSIPDNIIILNLLTAFCMIAGKLTLLFIKLAISDSLSQKVPSMSRLSDVQIDAPFFLVLILFSILNDALVFMPAIIIGPVIELLRY